MNKLSYHSIPLRSKNGFIRTYTMVDTKDYEKLDIYRWRLHEYGYAIRHSGGKNSKTIRMHREILGLNNPNIHVDHINGNKLDNRRSNLRIATRSQNEQNRTLLNRNNRSGHRGVFWSKKEQKWKVQATIERKVHCLGTFSDLEAAVQAATKFRAKHMPFSPDARK